LFNFKVLIISEKAQCAALASKKVRWPLCPARGAIALWVEALGKVPFLHTHKLAQQTLVCCPFLGKQKVTGATNRAISGG